MTDETCDDETITSTRVRDTLCPPMAAADAEGRLCAWTCPDCGAELPPSAPGAAPGCRRTVAAELADLAESGG